MKLSLKKILNELKPTSNIDVPYQRPSFGQQKTSPGIGAQPQQKQLSPKMKVDQGQQQVHQTPDGTVYTQGGVLHRVDGPARVPRGAHTQTLEGGTQMAQGGEYYLYGQKFPDFAAWYHHAKKLQNRSGKGPDTEVIEPGMTRVSQMRKGSKYKPAPEG